MYYNMNDLYSRPKTPPYVIIIYIQNITVAKHTINQNKERNHMPIFEKFQNTVFVKDSSELERKIKVLTEIKDKVKEKEQIEKEIK